MKKLKFEARSMANCFFRAFSNRMQGRPAGRPYSMDRDDQRLARSGSITVTESESACSGAPADFFWPLRKDSNLR
jgi:hypothetical protein